MLCIQVPNTCLILLGDPNPNVICITFHMNLASGH
jgi:hypothetical protein